MSLNLRRVAPIIAAVIVIVAAFSGGALADRLLGFRRDDGFRVGDTTQKILKEESVVVDVAEKVSPSVVTVSIQTPRRRILNFSPFGGVEQRFEGGTPRDIGSGFIVSSDGLIVTNKHVVDVDGATYKVITSDDKEYDVKEIDKDPSNDIAIIKIDATGLTPVELGDSDNLKVGQFVIAIGTALGEFRHTVTTGVISGLGRGIEAGNPFEGFVEQLDGVIQTDAAINPGNSGGPLLNSAGQVIGVNVAVAQGAQNIGFAIPIKIVKDGLEQFKTQGKFNGRPFLGVQYQMISRQTALLNDVPQGAYVTEVVADSPAQKAGVQVDDIITKIDDTNLNDEVNLADTISSKKVGNNVELSIWRDGQTLELTATLAESSE